MKRKIGLLCCAFLLTSCTANKKIITSSEQINPTSEPQIMEQTNFKLYEVTSTDTIASVSRKFKIQPKEIIIINQIPKPYYLKPGSIIKIPVEKQNDELTKEIEEFSSFKEKKLVTIAPPKAQNKAEPSENLEKQLKEEKLPENSDSEIAPQIMKEEKENPKSDRSKVQESSLSPIEENNILPGGDKTSPNHTNENDSNTPD